MAPRSILCALCCAVLLLDSAAASLAWRNVSVPSSGVTLSTLFAGAASPATPFIFLHGFPEGSYSWHGIFETGLLDSYQLVAPDLRGYNRSTILPTRDSYAIDLIAADIIGLIGVLGGGPVHLAAHDWGGAIAWLVAMLRPDLLLSLSIINMAHPGGWIAAVRSDPVQQAASAYVLDFVNPAMTPEMLANNFGILRGIFSAEAFFPADESAYVASWSVGGSVDAALNYYRANVFPHCPLSCTTAACWQQGVTSSFDDLPNNGTVAASLRVRVLWGMRDTAFDDVYQLAYIADKVAGPLNVSRYNFSHWLPQEAPLLCASELAAFVGA